MIRLAVISVLTWFAVVPQASAQNCGASGTAVQILGSGGPRVSRDRGSASYLVWIDGRSRVLVDAGGGAFLRFGQAGARLEDLSVIALSHFHPDHVSDLPALLWLSDQIRKERLPVSGPSGNDIVPGLPAFLSRLFDQKGGAFQVLGATLGGTGGGVLLDARQVDVTNAEPSMVFDGGSISVSALGIPHGNIPALAYRVRAAGVSIVFSTDQTGTNPRFVDFARGADVLVMHLAIAAGASSPLHAPPDVVGRVARDAEARRLVLSHIGLFDLERAVVDVEKYYAGPLIVGEDLQCIPVQ